MSLCVKTGIIGTGSRDTEVGWRKPIGIKSIQIFRDRSHCGLIFPKSRREELGEEILWNRNSSLTYRGKLIIKNYMILG